MSPHLRVPSSSHQRSDLGVDGPAARGLVGGEQLLAGARAAGRERRSEPPGPHAVPAEVLHRVAEVGELPVEDAAQAVAVDQEVAEAEVAVDDGVRGARRPVGLEPAERELEGRERRAERAGQRLHLLELVDVAHRRSVGDAGCGGSRPARRRPGRRGGDGPRPTRRRAAACGRSSRRRGVQHEGRRADVGPVVVGHHRRHGHALLLGEAKERGLPVHAGARVEAALADALQDQRTPFVAGDEVERERLARRPAREPGQSVDRARQPVGGEQRLEPAASSASRLDTVSSTGGRSGSG